MSAARCLECGCDAPTVAGLADGLPDPVCCANAALPPGAAECGFCHHVLPVAAWCFDGDGEYALCADCNAAP